MEQLQCTARELAEVSGLSTSVIGRYRSGQRIPAPDSEPFWKLCKGLCNLAEQKIFQDSQKKK